MNGARNNPLRRFRRGALAGLLSSLIGSVDQLVLVPLFLFAWSPELYGEWLTLCAVAAYVVFADLGLSSYVVNRLTQEHAQEAREEFLRTLHSALAFTLTVSAALLVAAVAAALVLPLDALLGIELLDSTGLLVTLIALQFVLSLPRGLVLGVYRAVGEYDRGAMLANVRRVASCAITALLLAVGATPLVVAAGLILPLIAVLAFALVDLGRRHAWLRFGVGERVPGLARTFLRPSVLFLGVQLSLVLVHQGSTIAVGALFGAGAVAAFATTRTLANLVRQLTGTLSNALWPELTRLAAQGRRETLQEVHGVFVKGLTALALTAALFLSEAGPALYGAWTRDALELDPLLFGGFLCLMVAQTPWTSSSYLLLATNRHEELARRQLLAAVAALTLGVSLSAWFGPRGLVLGILCAELALCAVQVPRNALALTGGRLGPYLVSVYGRGALVAALAWGALRTIAPLEHLDPAAGALATALSCPLVVGSLGWLLWLSPRERVRVTSLLRGFLRPMSATPRGSAS